MSSRFSSAKGGKIKRLFTCEPMSSAAAPSTRSSATRILHTMLRVGDLQRSIDFYTNMLGMTHLRTSDVPEEEYTLAFLGYNTEEQPGSVLELTYNYGKTKYDHGSAYGHIA